MPLEPDKDALDAWENMPKGKPSGKAMPPATGGMAWTWGLLALGALIALIFVLAWLLG